MHIRWLAAGVALAVVSAPPAVAQPNTQCTLTTPVQEVRTLSELPPGLLKLLPPIAEIGGPFNEGDAVTDPTLPFRRLIRAGHRGAEWFVWYERGGITYNWEAVVARVGTGGDTTVLVNAGTVSDMLCTVTDGAFAGQVPPYPQGTWAASSF